MKISKNILFAVVFLILICICVLSFMGKNGKTAEIYLDGELYREIDLSDVETGYTISVGDKNIILVESDGIRMQNAECPDKLCVKQGKISGDEYPIVCLPNKVIIKIKNR